MKTAMSQTAFLLASLLFATVPAFGQTYTNLLSVGQTGFDTSNSALTNYEGTSLQNGLVLQDGILYGTAWQGGTNGNGTVFSIHTDGTAFTVLHTFAAPYVGEGGTNLDGGQPHCTLFLTNNVLYGTTAGGGVGGYGTVFKLNTDGGAFTNLHNFGIGPGGINPHAGVVVVDDTLYGTASAGGTAGAGTVFKMETNGLAYATLHNFGGVSNSGCAPVGDLIVANGTIYGMTSGCGGLDDIGVVFALSTSANGVTESGFTNLLVFTGTNSPYASTTNAAGAAPQAGLVLSGDTLYGVTYLGGTNSNGIIFSVGTNGTGYALMHDFSPTVNNNGVITNGDGASPDCTLALSGATLYGTTAAGGTNGNGVIFSINTDGSGFTVLYDFYPIVVFTGSTVLFEGGSGSGKRRCAVRKHAVRDDCQWQ